MHFEFEDPSLPANHPRRLKHRDYRLCAMHYGINPRGRRVKEILIAFVTGQRKIPLSDDELRAFDSMLAGLKPLTGSLRQTHVRFAREWIASRRSIRVSPEPAFVGESEEKSESISTAQNIDLRPASIFLHW